jgi:glycosyltransferase involved in cell wall biosynthesis
MANKLVSIITPSYNSSRFIEQAIMSVLAQTYSHWEMLIVDDCSPDNSNAIIEKYRRQDNRIKLIKLSENSGPAVARNQAIEAAKGRYLAFLDADDLWLPEKLSTQVEVMQTTGCALSYSFYKKIDEADQDLGIIVKSPLQLTYRDMLKSNYIGCLTAMYDTQKIGKVYMPQIHKRQDYGLWLSILKKTDYAVGIDQVLAAYRITTNSISSNKFNLLKYNYLLFRKHEHFNCLKALYCVMWNIWIKIRSIMNYPK